MTRYARNVTIKDRSPLPAQIGRAEKTLKTVGIQIDGKQRIDLTYKEEEILCDMVTKHHIIT